MKNYKKYYFIISAPSVNGVQINGFSENPNIGGTEFVTIQLAVELAGRDPDFDVVILTTHPFYINDQPKNLKINLLTDDHEFANKSVVVLCSLSIPILNALQTDEQYVILWSHHPHDFLIKDANFKISELVSIGSYQYASNMLIYGKHSKIENVPPRLKVSSKSRNWSEQTNFVYLGSFARAKGLAKVISNFKFVHEMNPSSQLNIIGGTIYHADKFNIPAEIKQAYERLPKTVKDHVHFKGAVKRGKGKLVAEHDVALLNPTGTSEAFPASVLECYYQGVPVIASCDYGMSEFIPATSPLAIRTGNTVKCAVSYLNNSENHRKECARIKLLAEQYLSQRNDILDAWSLILRGARRIQLTPVHVETNHIILYRHVKFSCIWLLKKVLRAFK